MVGREDKGSGGGWSKKQQRCVVVSCSIDEEVGDG